MYELRRGVPKDYAEALKWSRLAALQGHEYAQEILGDMYNDGRGVPKDYAEAAKWYREAAEQGLSSAQVALGDMYERGDGVPRNDAAAVKWFRKAAEQYNIEAMNNLGRMVGKGQGVPQDYVEAYKWLDIAASYTKQDNFVRDRDIFAQLMTPTQIAEAQRLAREWGPAFYGRRYDASLARIRRAHEERRQTAAEERRRAEQAERRRREEEARRAEDARHAAAEEPRRALAVMDEIFVATKTSNVRAEPSIEAARVGRLTKGVSVTVLGKVADAEWYLVERDGERLGYVFAPLLAPEGSAEALAAVAPTRPGEK